MELAEIWQCGLSIDSAALAFEAKRSAYKSSKWKHRTTTTVLISPSCEKVGMAWKKRILSPPYLPLCWVSVFCVSNFKEYPETLSHLLSTTVSCLKFEESAQSESLTLHSFTKQLMHQWKTLKHSGVWCMVVFAVPTGRSNEGKGFIKIPGISPTGAQPAWRVGLGNLRPR